MSDHLGVIADLSSKIGQLSGKVDSLLTALDKTTHRLEAAGEDFESRIRELERRGNVANGIWITAAGLIGGGCTLLINWITGFLPSKAALAGS